ncbi:RNA dependent RNA polymerase-domain-containing protein [Hypoxylon trugodes]|uniref:RNA dependent RNA polymerase-domain-containing protein n=1 Tax=Hypoxylon trugodes TaxID=326681 RepID=UPI00218E2F4B|nr:RNA dependent RNA polymerase-domain-containing protein [Hypoxylon trugodes]KAI1386231.1 RNA dependent RNA polymerase-domain-containing protein [Hypoxylon trugodes]
MSSKKDKLNTYTHLLQDIVRLDDREWQFNVPNLPNADKLNQRQFVKVVTLVTKGSEQHMVLKLEHINVNRALRSDPLDRFMVVSLANFRPVSNVSTTEGALRPTTPRECTDYVIRLLRSGISLQGVHYNFYGHSNSQLKSRTCFLYAAPKEEVTRKVEALGDFAKMKTVAKKAKRIGLLFSTAHVADTVKPDRCEDIADIETMDYVFTDGCGLISPRLAQELSRKLKIVFRDRRYTPSVLQIRYRGYKGVVTLDPRLKKEPILLKLRKSMKKFSGGDDYSFSVVEYSKPYTFGFLNDEVVILLHSLGIPQSVLLKKQEQHFEFLATATRDERAAFRFLSYVNMPDLAEKVVMESLDSIRPRVNALVNSEFDKMLNKREEQKCRILVPQSRLLFGVCDAWGVLKEGECAVKVTTDGDGQPRALKSTEVLVTRNPCLHPGDLQKFKVVEKLELAHLVDCIVFPTQGRRPAADMMSGGDLDGDTFFVCWDSELIPSKIAQSAQYPGAREPLRFNPITDDDRLVYFAGYTNTSLGRVKNLYLDWARVRGPMCAECQELNRLFSQCVDGNRIKIPPKLMNSPPVGPDTPPFILDELHNAAKQSIERNESLTRDWNGLPFEVVELLLARDNIAMSEFELIRLTFKWCRKNDAPLEDFLDFFDFNVLAYEEKAWVLGQLPPTRDVPSLIMNALCSSSLVNEHELQRFGLNHPRIRWKRYFSSECDRLATFLDTATKTLELYHRKLILFRVDERLTVGIYVPQRVEKSQDCLVDDHVRLLAFPHSQGAETQSRLTLPTKKNYRLYCDENAFQLFEGQRGNTWIFIGRGPSDDSEYRNTTNKGDRRRQRQATVDSGVNFDCRASIALDKFSRGMQKHVGRVNRNGISAAEIYIISNRDTDSMNRLDLWLEYIDTEERLPLFEQTAKEYTIPSVKDVDWMAEPEYIPRIAKQQDFSVLMDMETTEEYEHLFSWLFERDQKGLLFQCFEYLLRIIGEDQFDQVQWHDVLQAMLEFLKRAPFLAVSFPPKETSDTSWHELSTLLESHSITILRAYVLYANDAQELIVTPFQSFLSTIQFLGKDEFADVVQLISLSVRSSEIALDLLLGSLERESSRILSGRPAVIHHFVRNLIGIAIDHIGEASEEHKAREGLLELKLPQEQKEGQQSDGNIVEIPFRIDAPGGTPETSAHVRLTTASPPENDVVGKNYSIDGLVVRSEQVLARIQCFHPLPPYFERCSWRIQNCGPFVTSRTMFDAVRTFATEPGKCRIREQILGLPMPDIFLDPDGERLVFEPRENLNASQNAAVKAVLKSPLICLWGPPGTGKTETIVEMIREFQKAFIEARILVTAPTHNAVDNVMRRYITRLGPENISMPRLSPLRVSTEVRKVAEDLRKYTCDAMAGQDINTSRIAHDQAKKRIKNCQIIFTTCIGSGLGLLRSQDFDTVIIDEASQQTEPASLVPLVKGCERAILVGDHVQLRPTVQPNAALVEFDVSLFERLYKQPDLSQDNQLDHPIAENNSHPVTKLMLDTQYRMHELICEFTSKEFYDHKLQTGIRPDSRPLFNSAFPWPSHVSSIGSGLQAASATERARMVFVECAIREDLGNKSKVNQGQAKLCAHICKLLCTEADKGDKPANPAPMIAGKQSIAVLTPYSRQVELLKRLLSNVVGDVEVSSIDGFQGREADIVVFVSVRCNERQEIGFLKDLRRMNVALTRARAGLIVIGNRTTLTKGTADPESTAMWARLVEQLTPVPIEI